MIKGVKIRLYPTFKQKQLLKQHFGGCRFVYNQALNYKINIYNESKTKLSKFDLIKWITNLRKNHDRIWMQDLKCEVVQNQADRIDTAYKTFFRGGGYPKFKSKRDKQSFIVKQSLKVLQNVNKLFFYGERIKFRCSELSAKEIRESKIKTITYSKDQAGIYHASIIIELNKDLTLPISSKEVGIDVGLTHFLTTSEGEQIDNPRFLKNSLVKLAREQKKFSKKVKGSNNRNKQRIKVARTYKKISNQRDHFLHQVTNKLINENQVISVETLGVKNMIQNHKLARSIADASWCKFISMLIYKAEWTGREIRKIDRFAPSSKTCSVCGHVVKDLKLSDRVFKCPVCENSLDRDLNAAINIKNFSRVELTRINASVQKEVTPLDEGRRQPVESFIAFYGKL